MCIWLLGGGFKYFLFPPLFGEASHFDYYFSDGLKPPTRLYHHKYGSISAECFFQLGIGFLPSRHVPPFRRQHQTWSTSGSTSCLSSLRWPLRCCENMTWTVWCDWHTHTQTKWWWPKSHLSSVKLLSQTTWRFFQWNLWTWNSLDELLFGCRWTRTLSICPVRWLNFQIM